MTTNAQLTLIESRRSWKLDEHTRRVGREGIARARAALAAGLRPVPTPPGAPGAPPDTEAEGRTAPLVRRPTHRAA